VDGTAIVVTNGRFGTLAAKTAHGLIRDGDRYRIVGVIDPAHAGRDAGEVLDGRHRGIAFFESIESMLASGAPRPNYCVVGIATPGGRLVPELQETLLAALRAGISIVNGLHQLASDVPALAQAARERGLEIVDVRKPRRREDLHFWSGAVQDVPAPRLAVLGADCATGKRTTARLLRDACRRAGLRAELIFTGQTGWMQGVRHGFILDSTPNDFVAGELENAIVSCYRETTPDLILLEGQAALRHPAGPCGAEFILSGGAKGVVLQWAPGRQYYDGLARIRYQIPSIEGDIELIRLYGARVLSLALNGEGLDREALAETQRTMQERLGIPVVHPLEGLDPLVPVVREFLEDVRPA